MMNQTNTTDRGQRMAAYEAGYTQGEIVRNSGRSADAHGMAKQHADCEWAWNEGYHDALNSIYRPEAM